MTDAGFVFVAVAAIIGLVFAWPSMSKLDGMDVIDDDEGIK